MIQNIIAVNKETNEYTYASDATNKCQYVCIGCNKDVILKKGNIRIHHFSHKSSNNICEIHIVAQEILKYILLSNIELIINKKCKCCNKITHITIPDIKENTEIKTEYSFEYNDKLKRADVAYIENSNILFIFEVYYTHKTKTDDRPDPWFELNAKEIIDSISDENIEKIHIDCIRSFLCDKCSEKGIIYFNQRGAGCGKTYESIQLIKNDERFSEKQTFIYLTKMHSAKEVIFNEFQEQHKCGKLGDLRIVTSEFSKQYKISCLDEKERVIDIIIGTIDSFTYAISNKSNLDSDIDYFKAIIKSIAVEYISSPDNIITYSRKSICLNKQCLIVIDESQDLSEVYINAFNNIITETNIDVYVIGDKLQSISGEHNIHTFIDNTNLSNHIERSNGINKVMRFHNEQFIHLVNGVIPFQKYNLPEISGICDGINCKYQHSNLKPYTIFEIHSLHTNNYQLNDYYAINIQKIINYMESEIINNNYLPNNFMFIFPLFKGNSFSSHLQDSLQQFWITKFKDEKYKNNVLLKNEYWKDKLNDDFHDYCVLHKSVEGQPINLKESEHATRILSIHASKGNGCEVVFLLDVTEESLKIFSKEKCNLVYDSLLHVAVTRQKKSLYIGIEKTYCDIYNRFITFGIKYDDDVRPKITSLKKYVKSSEIIKYIKDDDIGEIFLNFNNNIIQTKNYKSILDSLENNKSEIIIDWGHHMIRNSLMLHCVMTKLINNPNNEDIEYEQYLNILRITSNRKIEEFYDYTQYIKKLKYIRIENTNRNAKEANKLTIPIYFYSNNENTKYYECSTKLINLIKTIQRKIKLDKSIIPPTLGPLECVVLYFIICMMRGHYWMISIHEMYKIIILIEAKEENDIQLHYSLLVNKVDLICDQYFNYISSIGIIDNIRYNINHTISLGNPNNLIMRTECQIIGYCDNYVINFILRPSLNNINFNEIIIESIIQTFIIANANLNDLNIKKFTNKKVITCIITLDSNEPIFYEIANEKSDIDIIKNIISDCLFKMYSKLHIRMYEFYISSERNKERGKINSIDYVINLLTSQDYRGIPNYVLDFFFEINHSLKQQIKDKKSNEDIKRFVDDNVKNKDNFINSLNNYLQRTIDELLFTADESFDY